MPVAIKKMASQRWSFAEFMNEVSEITAEEREALTWLETLRAQDNPMKSWQDLRGQVSKTVTGATVHDWNNRSSSVTFFIEHPKHDPTDPKYRSLVRSVAAAYRYVQAYRVQSPLLQPPKTDEEQGLLWKAHSRWMEKHPLSYKALTRLGDATTNR